MCLSQAFVAPLRSSAARAAHRGTSPLPQVCCNAPWPDTPRFKPCLYDAISSLHQQPLCQIPPCAKADTLPSQAMARCKKCGSGLAPRCAARAALDLKRAREAMTSTLQTHKISQAMHPAPPQTFLNLPPKPVQTPIREISYERCRLPSPFQWELVPLRSCLSPNTLAIGCGNPVILILDGSPWRLCAGGFRACRVSGIVRFTTPRTAATQPVW